MKMRANQRIKANKFSADYSDDNRQREQQERDSIYEKEYDFSNSGINATSNVHNFRCLFPLIQVTNQQRDEL